MTRCLLAIIALSLLVCVTRSTSVDQTCIDTCSDYSGSLNFCRDAYDYTRESPEHGLRQVS